MSRTFTFYRSIANSRWCLLLVAGIAASYSWAAAPQISLPSLTAVPGSNVAVALTLVAGSSTTSSLQFDLQYDNTFMTLAGTLGAGASGAGKILYAADLSPNKKRFLIAGPNQTAIMTGPLLNLSVNLNSNAPVKISPLTLSNVAGSSPAGQFASVLSSDGAVTALAVALAQYPLSTTVSPPAGGSIVVNPASGSYFNVGTSVQLTAAPASGCVFLNWTGDVTGVGSQTTVTMTTARTVTANFQCGPASTSFVTNYAVNNPPLRNDFSGLVGMKLTVGASPISVTSLGRICAASKTMVHLVKLVNAANGIDVSAASANLNMAGCTAGTFVYGGISPTLLSTNSIYYLVSEEVYGGDRWYDWGSVSTTNAAVVNSSIYSYGGAWITVGYANTSYGPVSFQYTSGSPAQYLLSTTVSPAAGGSIAANPAPASGYYPPGASVILTATPVSGCTFLNWSGDLSGKTNPQAVIMSASRSIAANFTCAGSAPASFVSSYGLNVPPLRNDFGGWVGMKLTVGAGKLMVSSLGRLCVGSNVQEHTVKFVNSVDGSDVPSASAVLNMAGCSPGQFVYSVVNPISLQSNTAYYLVSEEFSGGDQWYDTSAISVTNAASVNSSVYAYLGNWITLGSASTSYVPVNFQYATQ